MFKPIKEKTLKAWAERKLGSSKCKQIIYVNRKRSNWLGEFIWETGTIKINLHKVNSYHSLYRTVAHEWTHAQQYYREYKYWDSRKKYEDNPLEKEANFVEKNLHRTKFHIIKARKMAKKRFIKKIMGF